MTATITAKVTPTPRKSRSRKSSTSKKSVTKYTQTPKNVKMTEETPVQVRPAQPNLKWEDYRDDVKVRWSIHQYETKELWNDLVKGYKFSRPYVEKTVTYVKDSYNRAFN